MGAISLRWLASVALALMALGSLTIAGCDQGATGETSGTAVSTIQVGLLIQVSEEDVRWFRDVEVPKGTNAYELTERVTEGDLEANYYPAFFSHFVEALMGVANEGSNYWLTFLWNANQEQWEPLPVGADLFSLKDGHVLAWSYTDTSVEPSQLPSVTP
ncbi:MAG: hypothetical protein O2783_06230 [Chloroflexi bacterium]|nr:hypothetical protein [Chloroflexota bacterium]